MKLIIITICSSVIGFAFHLCVIFLPFTWFLHLLHLFLGVVFPFRLKFLNEKKWKIRLHVFELLGSIVLCGLPPAIYISVSDYTIARFPPLFALPLREVAFYAIVLPQCIILSVGLNIGFYTFFSIHKVI